MKKPTQTSDVLKYIQTHKKGITSRMAIEMFGATRLSDIIYRLRKDHIIDTTMVWEPTRYGRDVEVARYTYVDRRNSDNL